MKERPERMEVSHERFDHYLNSGSTFVAEEAGEVLGYVASQTARFMHGVDKLLWIEYIVVQRKSRRRKIGSALLDKLADYARRSGIDRVYTTMNPDNEASIRLHLKAGFEVVDWKIASCSVEKG